MGAALWSWFLVGSCPQARSVLQGHGVLLFRNRPLGLRCGAALKAWELQFGAGFSGIITLETTLQRLPIDVEVESRTFSGHATWVHA